MNKIRNFICIACALIITVSMADIVNASIMRSSSGDRETQSFIVEQDVTINESGENNDTRIEGLNEENLLFVDASTDRIGIGNNNPGSELDVTGTVTATGLDVNGDVTANANVTLGDAATDLLTVNSTIQGASPLVFEGSTANNSETTFAITEPTADRTITFPDGSGTVAFLTDIGASGEWTDNGTTLSPVDGASRNVAIGLASSPDKLAVAGNFSVTTGVHNIQGGAGVATPALTVVNTTAAINEPVLALRHNATAESTILLFDDGSDDFQMGLDDTVAGGNSGDFQMFHIGGGSGSFNTTPALTVTPSNEVIINEGGADSNFTVEGDASDLDAAVMFVADSSEGQIGIGLSNPTAKLHVAARQDNNSNFVYDGLATFQRLVTTDSGSGGVSDADPREIPDIHFDLDETVTMAVNAGTVANQRAIRVDAPTYATSANAVTMTEASTLYIANAPQAGANVTMTNAYALNVADGATALEGDVILGDAATDLLTLNSTIQGTNALVFEGSTANTAETSFAITDPTVDRTITFPDASGTVAFTSDLGSAFINDGNSFGGTATIGTNDTESLVLETDGTARVTIDSSGNTSFTGGLFPSFGAGTSTPIYSFAGDTDTGIYNTGGSGDNLSLVSGGNTGVVINSSGQVGIAGATITEALSVNGNGVFTGNLTAAQINGSGAGLSSNTVPETALTVNTGVAGTILASNGAGSAPSYQAASALGISSLFTDQGAYVNLTTTADDMMVGASTAPDGKLHVFDTIDSGVDRVLTLESQDDGVPVDNGVGVGISFKSDTANNQSTQYATIDAISASVNNTLPAGRLEFSVASAGALTEVAQLDTTDGLGLTTAKIRNVSGGTVEIEGFANGGTRNSLLVLESLNDDGNGAADSSVAIDFEMENSAGAEDLFGRVEVLNVGTAAPLENGEMRFSTSTAGALTEKIRVDNNGFSLLGNNVAGSDFELRIEEQAANGDNYVGFAAPDSLGGNQIWTLPDSDGGNNEILTTNGSGTLAFQSLASIGGTSEITDAGAFLHPADLSGAESFVVGGTSIAGGDIILGATGDAVFNEQGNDVDFRIESNNDASMVFVDATNDELGIGTGNPLAKTDIVNSIASNQASQVLRLANENSAAAGGTSLGVITAFALENATEGQFENAALMQVAWQDVTGGAENAEFILSTMHDGTGTASQVLRIDEDGNFGIGRATLDPDTLLDLDDSDANNASVLDMMHYRRRTSNLSNGSAGLGMGSIYDLENNAGNMIRAAEIDVLWENSNAGSEQAAIVFTTAHFDPGPTVTTDEVARFDGNGDFVIQNSFAVNNDAVFGINNTDSVTFNAEILGASPLVFEGASDNGVTTTLAITNPTISSKTITFPNQTGTVALLSDIGAGGQLTDAGTFLHPSDLSGAESLVIGDTTIAGGDIILGAAGDSVFNEQGAAAGDFRVEGDSNANMINVDASADVIGIGTAPSATGATAQVNGGIDIGTETCTADKAGTMVFDDCSLKLCDPDGSLRNVRSGQLSRLPRAFVTSTEYDGDLGGIAGANAKCQTRAEIANLGGQWAAVLSFENQTIDLDANQRISSFAGMRRVNNATLSTGCNEVWDGTLSLALDMEEDGTAGSGGTDVWTGTASDGTVNSGNTCSNWTSAAGGTDGAFGLRTSATATWVASSTQTCDNTAHLYCVEVL